MSTNRSPVQRELLRRLRSADPNLGPPPHAGPPATTPYVNAARANPPYRAASAPSWTPRPRLSGEAISPAARNFVARATTSYDTKLRRRKALLIGIGYRNHKHLTPVPGARNDVLAMFELLSGPFFGFPQSDIHILCDEPLTAGACSAVQPTRAQIIRELLWLTEGIVAGDSVVFFFAGHGEMVHDTSGDEIDTGFDQCIMPVDFVPRPLYDDKGRLRIRGVDPILDDIIYKLLVKAVPEGAKVTAIVDACKSGTICDLPVVYDKHCAPRFRNGERRPPRHLNFHHKAAGGFVLFSGSADHQLSADMVVPVNIGNTDAVYEMCQSRDPRYDGVEGWSYGSLLHRIKILVKERCGQFVPSYLEEQEPQLSSSHEFDLWTTRFSM
ncbi:Meiotic coiled-coil protein [Gracilaria domingensis]|nr:Meiotic coiled-coil protein [Gracilaria domingensis]